MLSTCSPHRETCGMVPLQSPGHSPQYDHCSAIHEIRRNLSRSPSKTSEHLRQFTYRSSPARGALPFSPSPLSPSRRSTSDHLLHVSSFSSPHQNRFGQTSRINRPSLRRNVQGNSNIRTRTSPKSPTKRALVEISASGESSPVLRKRRSAEVDAEFHHSSDDKENNVQGSEDSMMWKSIQPRSEKRRSCGLLTDVTPRSPLKRMEGPMNLDQPDFGSPSTKKRSLYNQTINDFSIFDSDSMQEQKRSQDDNDWFQPSSPFSAGRFSTIPKRSSSLRKSTLQQRHPERFIQPKFGLASDDDPNWLEVNLKSNERKTPRISLDNFIPPMPRESPFSAQGNLLNASIHPVALNLQCGPQIPRHPLSRTITQSSSASSIPDDSPTHQPMQRPDRPKSLDFSKSLPVGALRPLNTSSQDASEYPSQGSFATPANYKSARPLPAAFMSTGLISKKNRNVEEPDAGLTKAHMPDTPCKKQSIMFDSNNNFRPAHPIGVGQQAFGTPATPAEAAFGLSRSTALPWAKNTNIFGIRGTKQALTKKASFASIETEEKTSSQSPSRQFESQSTDSEYPPTPTKHTNIEFLKSISTSPSSHKRASFPPSSHGLRFTNSKLSPVQVSPASIDGDSDSNMTGISPSVRLKPKSLLKVLPETSLSFTQSRALRNLNSPTPLSRKALFVTSLMSPSVRRTKISSLSPVSPQIDMMDRLSPRTPQEPFMPPDPSGLSISGRGAKSLTRPISSHLPIVPATPTASREYFGNFSNRPSLNLNAPDIVDVDRSLSSRFDQVDLVGTGEFSQVYRVTEPPQRSPFAKPFSASTSRPSSGNSTVERVWAVKKSRLPYSGPKDRQKKVHEVDVLKALGNGEHVVAFFDSWEDQGHLYIQTEYCEEGTLDIFLAQAGLKARLDDFRIWKILLELSLGLKHIHDRGFIHLDLKPANVLITFDGTLKIGDFGMASRWPAKSGIDGEGDREYIGPEILMGRYDKPADIFALGLMMLETAGNVELPDNGLSWQKLRQGDMSDVPSLTWSSEDSNVLRDLDGNPLAADEEELVTGLQDTVESRISRMARSGELTQPPTFMIDANHEQALDRLVRWMISPDPQDRPTIQQVLDAQGVQFAETRRRAGATIFEGNWGPADEIIAEDAEMIDV